jgi:hypothetical protein
MSPGRKGYRLFSRHFALFALFVFFLPITAPAQMSRLSDDELSEVSARSGITMYVDSHCASTRLIPGLQHRSHPASLDRAQQFHRR